MKKLTKTHKITIATSIVLGGILTSTPSYGFINIGNFLGSILDDIRGELELIQTLALTQIENTWSGIKADARAAIQDSVGDMGAPDPIQSGNELRNRLASQYSLPVAQEKAHKLERELARASISAILGEQGQQDTANKIQRTTQTAQEAQSLAEQAQEMDATQNVLKVMAAQNAQIVSLLAQQRTDSLQSRHDAAQTNLMLTQIAENLASQRQRENSQRIGLVAVNHELIGTLRLDPTHQE